MGKTTRNRCTYDYTVKLDLTPIVDEIIRRIPGDESGWELDGDELFIYMNDTAIAEEWSCNATRESPAEYELELQNSVEEVDVDNHIIEALHSVEKVNSDCEINYDSIEVDYPDPYDDGDRAYDEWRDRQYEDN